MTSEPTFRKTELTPWGVISELRVHGWTWPTLGAAVGLFGGILAPVVGAGLTAFGWFTENWHGFHIHRDGTALLVLTIPLLILGAHCLDLLDRRNDSRNKSSQFENERVTR